MTPPDWAAREAEELCALVRKRFKADLGCHCDELTRALNAAHARGQEAMREECAKIAEAHKLVTPEDIPPDLRELACFDTWVEYEAEMTKRNMTDVGWGGEGDDKVPAHIATAIRALTLDAPGD